MDICTAGVEKTGGQLRALSGLSTYRKAALQNARHRASDRDMSMALLSIGFVAVRSFQYLQEGISTASVLNYGIVMSCPAKRF